MARALEFHADAASEAAAARKWYQEIDAGLGDGFELELERAVNRISLAPERWPQHLHGTRCLLLHRFPYLIVYLHDSGRIQVVAVQHAKRRPGYWKSRT